MGYTFRMALIATYDWEGLRWEDLRFQAPAELLDAIPEDISQKGLQGCEETIRKYVPSGYPDKLVQDLLEDMKYASGIITSDNEKQQNLILEFLAGL